MEEKIEGESLKHAEFKNLKPLAIWINISLTLFMVFCAVSFAVTFLHSILFWLLDINENALTYLYHVWKVDVIGLIAFFAISFILFLVWAYRAYENLNAINAGSCKYGAKCAVIPYFVPIANFIRPYMVMTDLCNKSGARAGFLLPFWWVTFWFTVLWGVFQLVAPNAWLSVLYDLFTPFLVDNFSGAVGIALSVSWMLLVGRVTRGQRGMAASTE